MSVWDTDPILLKYQEDNPPPQRPKRAWIRGFPHYEPTAAYRAYLGKLRLYELEGIKLVHADLERRARLKTKRRKK